MADRGIPNRDNIREDNKNSQNGSVDREINELLKSQSTDHQAWQKLKSKYPNNTEFIDKVMHGYKSSMQKIYKKAKKFKEFLADHYSGISLSMGEMLRKAKKYQKKYKFTDAEFDMFLLLVRTDTNASYINKVPTTKMAKTLGYDALVTTTSKLNVSANEQMYVEEIVNKYGETKPLHAQVILQSLTYNDCANEALSGEFDQKKHNPYQHIHPVLAALFLPRIDLFEEHMLMANIGYIVQRKANDQQILTLPDFKLYWAMVTDPNDLACNISNALVDLKNRFTLQTQIWDAVLNLRQGKYYYNDTRGLTNFMNALENCRNIIHDAPDFTYIKDEGTILRRILSAFSLYPTYVSVNRFWGTNLATQYGYQAASYDAVGFSNITRVPMITLRLPFNISGVSRGITLEDALGQVQLFVENKTIVPKTIQIIHSNDILFFHVARKYQNINFEKLKYHMYSLPMTVSGWEKINEHPIISPKSMTIMNEIYDLRSVVLVEKSIMPNKDVIVGSSTMVIMKSDNIRFEEICVHYDPQRCGIGIYDEVTNTYERDKPIRIIPSVSPFSGNKIESFDQRASTRGTIFMYQKVNPTGLKSVLYSN